MANVLVEERHLQDIANAIRQKNGESEKYKPGDMAQAVKDISGGAIPTTYILEMQDGTEIPAVLTDQEVVFTATANDIRKGKVAATGEGIVTGEKIIPAYQTVQGYKVVMPGSAINITNLNDSYDYTKLQIIICLHNTDLSDSVAAEMISLENKVYNVKSVDSISDVIKNHENKTIDLGITNNFDVPCIVRYFTYREV